jgi:hypothetical protein
MPFTYLTTVYVIKIYDFVAQKLSPMAERIKKQYSYCRKKLGASTSEKCIKSKRNTSLIILESSHQNFPMVLNKYYFQ